MGPRFSCRRRLCRSDSAHDNDNCENDGGLPDSAVAAEAHNAKTPKKTSRCCSPPPGWSRSPLFSSASGNDGDSLLAWLDSEPHGDDHHIDWANFDWSLASPFTYSLRPFPSPDYMPPPPTGSQQYATPTRTLICKATLNLMNLAEFGHVDDHDEQ